ncbi:sulfatase-like hydrolase/transferase [Rhizobium leguminosarum]|uniref:sulfatase-like hydrolase/transferase n=1 Tax=Rhizobium leguminosarum TaxID=384 RepID=UPI00144265D0|nr:sulfatase-like hydrolase/transferase [Rhizobium leguminosarum]NKL78419.1 sulfatase-like hydrolase/transferase [Rhizobium leguminosarum bv. viciae]
MNSSPNVIVFFTDQQRWDTVGLHGHPLRLTPNFDRLAQAGMFVPNSFTCQPVCGPARSALQTGLYPTTTGCFRNDIPLPPEQKTLAHHFAKGGYETSYIGKWHLASREPVPPEQRGGYQHWLASNILEFTSYAYDTTMFNAAGEAVKLPGYRVDALTDAAIRYVAQPRDKPYFLFLSFIEPHHQNEFDDYPAPVGYEERIRERMELPPDLAVLGGSSSEHYPGYMGMIQRLDEALGRLVDTLVSLKQLDNTVILFTSDHGCHFKTRNKEYKRSCHEASIRVPTFFHGPGFMNRGPYEGLASLIDLPPTLLAAAGLPVPDEMQGRSIFRCSPLENESIFVQISESHVGRALRTRRWKYEVGGPELSGWHDMNGSAYVETHLYDLEKDPYELDNLCRHGEFEDVRKSLRTELLRRIADAGEPLPTITPI